MSFKTLPSTPNLDTHAPAHPTSAPLSLRVFLISLVLLTLSVSQVFANLVAASDFQNPATSDAMSRRSIIKNILNIEQAEGVGARVRRSIGSAQLPRLDPFLLLDHFNVGPEGGFPDHPHRGFETVTYMLSGEFKHEDFAGHAGTIGAGDLQWMTAGRGIVHAEMPSGTQRNVGLQLWVNLPAKSKMCEPKYQELRSGDVPLASAPGVKVKVIAGSSLGVDAKVLTQTPIVYLDVSLEKGAVFEQALPEGYRGFAYVLEGKPLVVQGTPESVEPRDAKVKERETEDASGETVFEASPFHTIVFSDHGDNVVFRAEEPSRFMIIAGKPINEPVVQYGPFVMNTRDEIQNAMLDFRAARNGFERAASWRSKIGN